MKLSIESFTLVDEGSTENFFWVLAENPDSLMIQTNNLILIDLQNQNHKNS